MILKIEKDLIPDGNSILDLLNIIANNFVLNVVKHADT